MLRSIPTKWFTINYYWRFDHMLWPSSEYIKQTETREQREICTLSSSSLYTDWLRGSQMTSLIIVSNLHHLGLWPLFLFRCCLVVCLLLCSIRRFRQQSMLRHWSQFISSLGFWRRCAWLPWSTGWWCCPLDPGSLSPPRGVGGVGTRHAQQWLTSQSVLSWCLPDAPSIRYPTPSSSHQCISVHNCMESHTPPLMPALQNLCPWACTAHVLVWRGFWTLSWY